MIDSWMEAGRDLGVEVIPSCRLEIDQLTFTCLLVKDFGSVMGTIVMPMDVEQEVLSKIRKTGYFLSRLNPESYCKYDRELFIDTLNDWGYFGPASKRPGWYTGKPWT